MNILRIDIEIAYTRGDDAAFLTARTPRGREFLYDIDDGIHYNRSVMIKGIERVLALIARMQTEGVGARWKK